MSLDVELISKEIAEGYINEQRHPTAPLRILNYSPRAQFDWHWNSATMQCRGLIVDEHWNIVSRPFEKFFNLDQLKTPIPAEPFEVYEKMDGSLGILYHVDDQPFIATRGSFTSDQAQWATEIYRENYADIPIDKSATYLFEIIHPSNRIVVDYGNLRDLILLAVIDNATGKDRPLPDIGFPVVARYYNYRQFDHLLNVQRTNHEGFVVKFESGQRIKIKFEEYKRLHKLITGISARDVWEAMRENRDMGFLADRVPDEFHVWLRDTQNKLQRSFNEVEATAQRQLRTDLPRKELAAHFAKCKYPNVMFAMLDGKNYTDIIWKMLKPSPEIFKFINDIDAV